MTLSGETESNSLPSQQETRRVVVMARHGERQDYVDKATGSNWVATADKPWDPPLSERGVEQSMKMGRAIQSTLKELELPLISKVYSSPLTRCRQTAAAAIQGLSNDNSLYVLVEDGLMESVNAAWFGSWCLPESDSTWGYRPKRADGTVMHIHEIDVDTIHKAAKKPVQELLHKNGLVDGGDDLLKVTDTLYESKSTVPLPYCWDNFETRQEQRDRMQQTMELLAQNGKSTMCVSHGGPVTHLYEQLTGKNWEEHGESSYTCVSIYVQEHKDSKWKPVLVNDASHLH